MKMEPITVWAAHGDGGERSAGPIIGYFSDKDRAESYAKGKGWYGGNGWVSKFSALHINDQIWLLASPTPIDINREQEERDAVLREATIAELSPEQRRVLGIK